MKEYNMKKCTIRVILVLTLLLVSLNLGVSIQGTVYAATTLHVDEALLHYSAQQSQRV